MSRAEVIVRVCALAAVRAARAHPRRIITALEELGVPTVGLPHRRRPA
jgi:hypothetical protein